MTEEKNPEKRSAPPSSFADEKPALSADGTGMAEASAKAEKRVDDLTKPKFTHGIILLASADFSMFNVVEDFEHDGQVFKQEPGLLQMLVNTVHTDIQNQQISAAVINRLLNETVTVQLPDGLTVKLKIPHMFGQLAGDAVAKQLLRQQVKANPGGIIHPGSKFS